MSNAKQLYMSVVVILPHDDLFEAGKVCAQLGVPWRNLITEVEATGLKYEARVEEMNGRTTSKMPRRRRKPRLVTPDAAA